MTFSQIEHKYLLIFSSPFFSSLSLPSSFLPSQQLFLFNFLIFSIGWFNREPELLIEGGINTELETVEDRFRIGEEEEVQGNVEEGRELEKTFLKERMELKYHRYRKGWMHGSSRGGEGKGGERKGDGR